ncbi:MAG: EAL domain-containing protein [Gemmatimonadaceae bacterium]
MTHPHNPPAAAAPSHSSGIHEMTEGMVAAVRCHPDRLAVVHELGLLDQPAEAAFERLTGLMQQVLGVPVVLVTLIDAERDFILGHAGLPEAVAGPREIRGSPTFCQYSVAMGHPFSVEDARLHPRFSAFPAVASGAVACANVPLITASGQAVGNLCLIDFAPRAWTDAEHTMLRTFAATAVTELDLRRAVRVAEHATKGREEVLERVPDALFTLDAQWRFTFVNTKAEAILQRPRHELLGQDIWQLFPEGVGSVYDVAYRRAVREGTIVQFDVQFDAQFDAIGRCYDVHAQPRAGSEGGLSVYLRDITDRHSAEADLRSSELRFRSVTESATDAIVAANADNCIVFWNSAAERVFGYPASDAMGKPLTMLMPSHYRAAHTENLKRIAAGGPATILNEAVEVEGLRSDGTIFPMELSVGMWDAGESAMFTAVIRDITQRKQLEEQLAYQAFHDSLTGLANRMLFRDRVDHALARTERGGHVAVLFIDLDDFKTVNDSLGHGYGDALLSAVASRLLRATRGCDTVARLGGDEFAVLLEAMTSDSDADVVVGRIMTSLELPILIDSREVLVSASVGVAHAHAGETVDELLRNADVAMYHAKDKGKGTATVFEPIMHKAAVDRLELGADLSHALERQQLFLVYQPIIDLENGGIQGVEALARWQHPVRGIIPPLTFIPIAEESGTILRIGQWVLETACQQLVDWDREGSWALGELGGQIDSRVPLSVNVNVSARQLQDPALVGNVAAVLVRTGIKPDRLVLEITETVVMQNTKATLETLCALKALGVRLAIDDFGTGYSSLSYLQQFPIDILKIDKTFVDGMVNGGSEAALTETIVALGKALQMRLVAEGVEGSAQRDRLRALGCSSAQGYLFARPLSPTQLSGWIATGESSARGELSDRIVSVAD